MKKKHVIALVCVLALVVSLMSSFAFAADQEETVQPRAATYRVVRQTVLYKGPGTSYGIETNLPVNTIVYRLDTSSTGGYYHVRATKSGGTEHTGYVHYSYLSGIS